MNIGILLLSTSKYNKFIDPLLTSIKKYFFLDSEVKIFLHTDSDINYDVYKKIHINHEPWPYITLKRFDTFVTNKSLYEDTNYLFYLDIDSIVVDYIKEDILSDFVAVLNHYHIHNKNGPIETNTESTAYIKPNSNPFRYVAGGFFGAESSRFLSMSEELASNINIDLSKNIIARLHDESHLNYYCSKHNDIKLLSPEYMYFEHLEKFPNPKIIAYTNKIKGFNKNTL